MRKRLDRPTGRSVINLASSQRVSLWRRRLKQKAIDYKGGCCQVCEYNKCNSALEFHHLDPSQKDFHLGQSGHTRAWDRVRIELDKCILLCSNCHKEVHTGIISLAEQGGRA